MSESMPLSRSPSWLLDGFLEHLEWERNLSPATLRAYRREIRTFIDFSGSELGLRMPLDVSPVAVRAYLAHLHSKHLAPSSIARALASIRTYFRFLVAENTLVASPAEAVPFPHGVQQTPEVADRYTIEELLEGFPDTAAGRRDRAAVELLYAAGLRVGELVALDLADLNLDRRLARIRGKGRKERLVPFGRPAATAIAAYLPSRKRWRRGIASEDDPLFAHSSSISAVAGSVIDRSGGSSMKACAALLISTISIRTLCVTRLRPIFSRPEWICV